MYTSPDFYLPDSFNFPLVSFHSHVPGLSLCLKLTFVVDGVAESDFITWNPSLSGTNHCVLSQDLKYCVQFQLSQSPNITSSCVRYQLAGPGYSCNNTIVQWGVELDQLYAWNPDIGSSCQNWLNGEVIVFQDSGAVLANSIQEAITV